jgi:hypothetical protein
MTTEAVAISATHAVIAVHVKITINNLKKELKMEQYISMSIYIKDNKTFSVHLHPFRSERSDYIDQNFNYYKTKQEYIAEIVVSDDKKGILLKSSVGGEVTYHQTIKGESMVDAIATVVDIVNNHVLTLDFATELKNKEIELLEKQSQELIEKANKLKGEME